VADFGYLTPRGSIRVGVLRERKQTIRYEIPPFLDSGGDFFSDSRMPGDGDDRNPQAILRFFK
jgi:hypothetical protein